MKIPANINEGHLLKAVARIDSEGIPPTGNSLYYDAVLHGKKYPPKLIISYANSFANGNELARNTFNGGSDTECFKLLEKNGFMIIKKDQSANTKIPAVWIEKTIVKKRPDRLIGDFALGKVLWSPQKDKGNADIYSSLRKVSIGDIVLHLTDNKGFTGVSLVKETYSEGEGIKGTAWAGPAYIVKLKDYKEINFLSRNDVLSEANRSHLKKISETDQVFYNKDLNLNQGKYLTSCPPALAHLINQVYLEKNEHEIPYLGPLFNKSNNFEKEEETPIGFDYNEFNKHLDKAHLKFSDQLIHRFIASLCAKPFVILTGLSGSGKTKLAQSFSLWISENQDQICLVPVGADWTNREPLLGFPNALLPNSYVKPENGALDLLIEAGKIENVDKPYFLILDEMNLSHVERYFADFLSAMESSGCIPLHSDKYTYKDDVPNKLQIPNNFFIIGTVNIDETTYMFSPKVLDRANVIEFRVTHDEMNSFLSNPYKVDLQKLTEKGGSMGKDFLRLARLTVTEFKDSDVINPLLMTFFQELKKAGAEFGYRTASEIYRLISLLKTLDNQISTNELIDIAIMQKLLPKLHGSRRKLEPILKTLITFCIANPEQVSNFLENHENIDYSNQAEIFFPISLEKIVRMYNNAIKDGFTSYAEA